MGIIDKIRDYALQKGYYRQEEQEEYYEEEEVEEDDSVIGYPSEKVVDEEMTLPPTSRSKRKGSYDATSSTYRNTHLVDMNARVKMEVVIVYPGTIEEAGEICDCIKDGKTVVMNLEKASHELSQRIVDFLGGVTYALDGDIQCASEISSRIFVIAPQHVDISGYIKEDINSGGLLFSFKSAFK